MKIKHRGAVAIAAAAVATLAAASAYGAIVGSSGQVEVLAAPPASVDFGALESNTVMRAFDEKQDFTLAGDVCVDISSPGTYDDLGDLTPGVISAGTKVSSQFVHADKVGQKPPFITYEGSVTTDGEILGVAVLQKCLDQTDVLGALGTIYPTGKFGRGLSLNNAQIEIVMVDTHTVHVKTQVKKHVDQIRILTAPFVCRKEDDDDTTSDDDSGGDDSTGDGHSADDSSGGHDSTGDGHSADDSADAPAADHGVPDGDSSGGEDTSGDGHSGDDSDDTTGDKCDPGDTTDDETGGSTDGDDTTHDDTKDDDTKDDTHDDSEDDSRD